MPPDPDDGRYLRRMAQLGVLDEVDAIYDAAERGEIPDWVTVDELLAEVERRFKH